MSHPADTPEWFDSRDHTEVYEHHGAEVNVITQVDLPLVLPAHFDKDGEGTTVVTVNPKGRHRSLCLCYGCARFLPGEEDNCSIAQDLYANCIKHNVVTPVLECPEFVKLTIAGE